MADIHDLFHRDRIVVVKLRGKEVRELLAGMSDTDARRRCHRSGATDFEDDVEYLVAMTGYELPINVIRQYIASGIGLVVHLARLKGVVRKVIRIIELMGAHNGEYARQELFAFEDRHLESGVATGRFKPTGSKPTFLNRLDELGIAWRPEWFSEEG